MQGREVRFVELSLQPGTMCFELNGTWGASKVVTEPGIFCETSAPEPTPSHPILEPQLAPTFSIPWSIPEPVSTNPIPHLHSWIYCDHVARCIECQGRLAECQGTQLLQIWRRLRGWVPDQYWRSFIHQAGSKASSSAQTWGHKITDWIDEGVRDYWTIF